ncbi:MAG: EutN/CcmL family microcompartment protein, partial [Candidatus Atribacteria bacterium]|nr:EutN/CcmL family microcompartment protein [Candidatus Atribacteria bacterium]
MKLGKVIGNVVCTQKIDSFEGLKLLLVQPLNEKLEEIG